MIRSGNLSWFNQQPKNLFPSTTTSKLHHLVFASSTTRSTTQPPGGWLLGSPNNNNNYYCKFTHNGTGRNKYNQNGLCKSSIGFEVKQLRHYCSNNNSATDLEQQKTNEEIERVNLKIYATEQEIEEVKMEYKIINEQIQQAEIAGNSQLLAILREEKKQLRDKEKQRKLLLVKEKSMLREKSFEIEFLTVEKFQAQINMEENPFCNTPPKLAKLFISSSIEETYDRKDALDYFLYKLKNPRFARENQYPVLSILASSGGGKSHFIDYVANYLNKFENYYPIVISFNNDSTFTEDQSTIDGRLDYMHAFSQRILWTCFKKYQNDYMMDFVGFCSSEYPKYSNIPPDVIIRTVFASIKAKLNKTPMLFIDEVAKMYEIDPQITKATIPKLMNICDGKKISSLWSTFDVSIYGATSTNTNSNRPIVWIPLYPCNNKELIANKFAKYIHYYSVQIALTLCGGHWRSLNFLWDLLNTKDEYLSLRLQLPQVLLDTLITEVSSFLKLFGETENWEVVLEALYSTLFNQARQLNSNVSRVSSGLKWQALVARSMLLNTIKDTDESVVPVMHLLWLTKFISSYPTINDQKYIPIHDSFRELLTPQLLSDTSSGSEIFEKFTIAFEQLRWNCAFLYEPTAKLPTLDSWFYPASYSRISKQNYELFIRKPCTRVDTSKFDTKNFRLLNHRPSDDGGSSCGLAPAGMPGFDSFQWVPMILSSDKVGDKIESEVEYFLFLFENRLSSKDATTIFSWKEDVENKIRLIKMQLILENIDERKVVYVHYAWRNGPEKGIDNKECEVPWNGDIIVMLRSDLDKRLGPTFSSYFDKYYYFNLRTEQEVQR